MQIELQPYERSVLEVLALNFSLERELTVGLAIDLNLLANLFSQVISCPDNEFKAGRVAVMGLLNHAHCLLTGGLQALQASNPAVWSGCTRGLIEIFGACVLISERPDTAPNYLEDRISAGKLYSAAARPHSGLDADIKRLHLIVHVAIEKPPERSIAHEEVALMAGACGEALVLGDYDRIGCNCLMQTLDLWRRSTCSSRRRRASRQLWWRSYPSEQVSCRRAVATCK